MGGSFAPSLRTGDRVDPDMDVEPELPSLEAIIPKEELRKLKQKEKKRQEVINGQSAVIHIITFVCLFSQCRTLDNQGPYICKHQRPLVQYSPFP